METVTSKDGTTIAFDRVGEGPPLTLVTGATATRTAAAELASALAEHFTVYSYDRRGRGDSGDIQPYAVEREIEDLGALIAEAGGSAFVFGHSSGAVLALRAAASGLDISKLAVYEPPFIADDSRAPLPDDYIEHLDELIAQDRRADAVAYFMRVAVGIPDEYIDQMKDSPMWEPSVEVAHTIAYDGRIMGDTMSGKPLSAEPWASISIPTLVMDGGNSEPFMHNGARSLAGHILNAQHCTLDGQDHGPADDVLVPVLQKFFAS